ncbi:beta-ketothiolase BktB [Roseibium sediminicola]|uniref:Beta-ketothiolase BktB n=1 Tax=Roseibium sediminicola TaxID=2933272 RepID=A0ABT0GZY9_9HYPH|nr:beta-ketothiolase BktB [Roseibium sp. CAU 1639]MCK7614413.1 beta-ketothiolase BktB [Roseibium sp. CAU 1639]
MTEIVIASAARTAVGSFGGALKDSPPCDLATTVAKAAIERAGIEAGVIDQAFFGNVIHTEPRDMYLSRVASRQAGVPDHAPALTMNRLCGSGLQAIVSAVQAITLGDGEIALAGGAENMSRAGYSLPGARFGQKMGDAPIVDMMTGALHDPFGIGHMGVTAENVAEEHGISRERQDAFALESHRRASAATKAGFFKDQIVPLTLGRPGRETVFDTDEHVRHEAKIEDMEKLRAVFKKDGRVTAGNASGLNDGAAALVLMSADKAKAHGVTPLARIRSYGIAGVDPAVMGIGPVPAMQIAMKRAGIAAGDLDVVESNEAFAAQACAVNDLLGLPEEKVNPNGGAVALGHPIGATGAIIMTKLVYELQRGGGSLGAATMCIGGGQGIAVIVETVG